VPETDIAIAGGGPAGLAVAIEAATRGLRCVVFERDTYPVDKACGEGLLPDAAARLQGMGVEIPSTGSHALRGLRYVDGEYSAAAEFVDGPGLGVRRTALSLGMLDRATALGVDIRVGCDVRQLVQDARGVRAETSNGALTARWMVAADGLHSRVRAQAGIASRLGRRRFGARRHYRVRPWSSYVEVHWADGVEAYVTPVGPELVGVAFLWSAGRPRYDAFLRRFEALRVRLGTPVSSVRGSGPFAVRTSARYRGRVFLVGDAAGYTDALSGEGLGLAFAGARVLVEALAQDAPRAYARRYDALMQRHRIITAALLGLARRPRLRRRVMEVLARRPERLAGLIALGTGARGYVQSAPSLLKLLVSVLMSR
jgi:flavin-dependent dehydrogenase